MLLKQISSKPKKSFIVIATGPEARHWETVLCQVFNFLKKSHATVETLQSSRSSPILTITNRHSHKRYSQTSIVDPLDRARTIDVQKDKLLQITPEESTCIINQHDEEHRRFQMHQLIKGGLDKSFKTQCDKVSGTFARIQRQLQAKFVDLCKKLLLFEYKSIYSCYHRSLIFLGDLIKPDDWKGSLEAVQDAKAFFNEHVGQDVKQLVNRANYGQEYLKTDDDKKCLRDLCNTDPRMDKSRIESTKGGLFQDSYR
ncbi:uncharacterized protein TRIVIDRAFT_69118 [Trichoderma virens Gv29-8]|uniref:NWD NACHT-NTPase N-terminal domain-containing protein n=1 Tax=Hypocrea virens (strain Gv29-8 / FGSC 10586) TaxID=413071 RepID=G9MYH1_HYPVG|nr:uncharacterized protein TRIVIDRAFT_69118 [Trichoderma virens Gv29-8]EHK20591.1 hypothetical protein TRIVIDRAFT_69118 [Trichoderma virens Gv29-8]UKZ53053.1 hypothetical protein TrVGV298_006840 [Trichoderma virens]